MEAPSQCEQSSLGHAFRDFGELVQRTRDRFERCRSEHACLRDGWRCDGLQQVVDALGPDVPGDSFDEPGIHSKKMTDLPPVPVER